ncbi:PH (Pleckstrin Homology) domain-containing protein [Luteibacter rhizovicinus]|uniref:PH (Pleckstrin Homology) domain-containing protein n=1 Tax=Luteibacter rhizovicinus TaxID=242606 RepID=A0A4R3YHS9_9GAMM|nr:PH domain-containing protein [Luteibacter rhizovicinus]TCV91631.1 PH (Pleckstrin Homology) domain-containing protein [Luteibacter rhizovicinus]
MRQFTATRSGTVLIATTLFVLILVGVAGLVAFRMQAASLEVVAIGGLAIVAFLGMSLVTTQGYEVGEGMLVIRRALISRRFPLRGALVRTDDLAMSGAIRVFGNGGLFAVDGLFYSRRLGWFRAYIRNSDHLIVVTLVDGRTVVVSPDDPLGFVEAAMRESGIQQRTGDRS